MKRFPLFLLAACGCLLGDSIGPSETDALGLHLHLSIHPETVNSGDDFGARLVLENPTADTVHFEGGGCLAFLSAYAGDELQTVFEGTIDVCIDILVAYPVPPLDSLVVEHDLRAGNRDELAKPGTYKLRADFNVAPALPRLEGRFVVR